MDALANRRLVTAVAVVIATSLSLLAVGGSAAHAAAYRTTNFVVQASTPALAREIGDEAERLRRELSIDWLGEPMPDWPKPCPISARVSPTLGAGGATSFIFDRGEVFGWEMNIQGSRQRVLDSVLPHEITHTVFACHFRQPLPRWADEGACTTVEHPAEIRKQERMLIRFLKTGKGIPFSQMFRMKDYPADVLPLYSQGHSLATFLIERRGKKAYLEFVAAGLEREQWVDAVREHYGHNDLYDLQTKWLAWVEQGRPRLALESPPAGSGVTLASNTVPVSPRKSPADVTPMSPNPPATQGPGSVYTAMAEAARASSGKPVYDASRVSGTVWR